MSMEDEVMLLCNDGNSICISRKVANKMETVRSAIENGKDDMVPICNIQPHILEQIVAYYKFMYGDDESPSTDAAAVFMKDFLPKDEKDIAQLASACNFLQCSELLGECAKFFTTLLLSQSPRNLYAAIEQAAKAQGITLEF